MFVALVGLALVGCRGNAHQSMLHPASGEARELASLWWVMVAVYGVVLVVTLALAGVAVLRRPESGNGGTAAPGGGVRFVVIAGMLVPALILLGMQVYALQVARRLRAPETELTIVVTGQLWWWDVRYPAEGIVTANEIRIPVGVPVELRLGSADVIHSFWVPNLHGKMDMFPEHMNRFWLRADRAGYYRGICAEFCGMQHALMGIDVIAMPQDEYDAWVARRQAPRPALIDPLVERGHEVFFSGGCAACHAIGGTAAVSTAGPDLSHLASRRNLAASTLPNTAENLARWIVEPQAIKPGNLMPPSHLEPADLKALVKYLQTLD